MCGLAFTSTEMPLEVLNFLHVEVIQQTLITASQGRVSPGQSVSLCDFVGTFQLSDALSVLLAVDEKKEMTSRSVPQILTPRQEVSPSVPCDEVYPPAP